MEDISMPQMAQLNNSYLPTLEKLTIEAEQPISLYSYAVFAIVFSTLVWLAGKAKGTRLPGAPVAGKRFPWEPEIVTRYRFPFGGWKIIHEGYEKNKHSPFTLLRPEYTITVLPKRYVGELHNTHDSKFSPKQAIVNDMVGSYTGMNVFLKSFLSAHAIRTRLTPRLPSFSNAVEGEIDLVMEKHLSGIEDEWVSINLQEVVLDMISRFTMRLFVGFPLCRNEGWLSLNISIVKDIFQSMIILRMFPQWLHPAVALAVPCIRRVQKSMTRIQSILVPMIEERRQLELKQGVDYERSEDVLQYMMDLAKEEETDAATMVVKYVFTIIGSMHVVTEAFMDTLYELCERTEYVAPLREEMERVLAEDGGWLKGTAVKMRKLDSFMKETQRFSPPTALGFRRVVREPITLSDGLILPKDTFVGVATTTHLMEDIPNFDGFRNYRQFLETESGRCQYTSSDSDQFHFGIGRYACPGRFIASTEIKMIMSKILGQYDVKFVEGVGRPKKTELLEVIVNDPEGRVMMRQRVT